ncbi:hypothetical protein B0H65DRAFT_549296 [Neurospora tetraspora]|uniref:Uncharacterized protein n=1 Tax=Neurospora tetraspora TaxID=94610 RepID=A0AAE0JGD3_9PEZI|nr:hypothetical protein B0H65DRAFT_549296 [Neurospora tetraspora]
MSASNSTNNNMSPTTEVEDVFQAFFQGAGSPSDQRPASENAHMPSHTRSFSMFSSVPAQDGVFGHSQATSFMPFEHRHSYPSTLHQFPMQAEQVNRNPMMTATSGFPSMPAMTQSYGAAESHFRFPTPMVNQSEWISTQGVMAPEWTERHTEILKEGKRLGKTVPQIVTELYQLDGRFRSSNCVTKRWLRMKESCVSKRERDTIIYNLTPTMVQLIYTEVARLQRGRMMQMGSAASAPGLSEAIEQDVKDIARRHLERCIQDMVVRLSGNEN